MVPASDFCPASPVIENAGITALYPMPITEGARYTDRMYVLEAAPIVTGSVRTPLSFFSRIEVARGSIVSVPVRGRMVPALVVSVRSAADERLDLRSLGYTLKKIGPTPPRRLFSEALMRAVSHEAEESVSTEGAVIAQVCFAGLIAEPRLRAPEIAPPQSDTRPEVLLLEAEVTERVHAYRSMVREAFARGASVLIIAPSLIEVSRLTSELGRGIEERTLQVSSALTGKALRTAWDRALHPDPVLVVGTPHALSFPIATLDTIVVERESARSYVLRSAPRVDVRRFAEHVAREQRARLVYADFPLRAETAARRATGDADDASRPQIRSQSTATVEVRDMRAQKTEGKSFTPLAAETIAALGNAHRRGLVSVVYAARSGVAPLTVCRDCGTPITDPTTGAPMVLHKTPRGTYFFSHRSGAVMSAERSCATCGGWNLISLGIGVERVRDALTTALPDTPIECVTADTVRTHPAALRAIERAQASGAVIVGTDRMLPYLPRAAVVAVASIDSMLSLTNWRAEEHALHTLYTLLERATESFIIETRQPNSRPIQNIVLGTPSEYVRDELAERRTYGYPPYATFIGLEWRGTEARCAEEAARVKQLLAGYDIVGPLPPEAVLRGVYRARATLRLEPNAWPEPDLLARLRSLPPSITCTVDPDDIV